MLQKPSRALFRRSSHMPRLTNPSSDNRLLLTALIDRRRTPHSAVAGHMHCMALCAILNDANGDGCVVAPCGVAYRCAERAWCFLANSMPVDAFPTDPVLTPAMPPAEEERNAKFTQYCVGVMSLNV